MTQEFIPSTVTVREMFAHGDAASYEDSVAAFDRWLAAHDAQIRAEALKLTIDDIRAGCLALSDNFHEQGIGPNVMSPEVIELDPIVTAILSSISKHRMESKS